MSGEGEQDEKKGLGDLQLSKKKGKKFNRKRDANGSKRGGLGKMSANRPFQLGLTTGGRKGKRKAGRFNK